MNKVYFISILMILVSCRGKNDSSVINENQTAKHEIIKEELQTILDSAKVQGSILIFDLENDKFYSNNFNWARKGKLPASTFKIANSIVAIEANVIVDDNSILEWNGVPRRYSSWEQNLSLRDAFHYSCVPCYKEIARDIGPERMNRFLGKLDYGTMKVDSTNIDMFWLEGESQINQFQQIDFLKRLHESKLAISERTELIIKRMMVIEQNEEYIIRGKTGWSITNEIDNGWFVGYIESQKNTYFFATNIEPKDEFDRAKFSKIRKKISYKALEEMGLK